MNEKKEIYKDKDITISIEPIMLERGSLHRHK